MRHPLAIFLLIFGLVSTGASVASYNNQENYEEVSLQLNWAHQFRFAGYYMAIEKGFYAQNGIKLNLLNAKVSGNSIDTLLNGQANYAISGADALIAKANKMPLVALSAISHESPLALMVRKDSDINTASDLRNKTIMLGETNKFAIIAMLKKAGLNIGDYQVLPITPNHSSLITKQTDAYPVYITDKGYFNTKHDTQYRYLRPKEYGLQFYNDILITTEEEINSNRFRARDFREASLKGWKYAFANINETIDLINKKYAPSLSREQLQLEADEFVKLVRPLQTDIGSMKRSYWQHMLDTFVNLGMLESTVSLDRLIYTAKNHDHLTHLQLTTEERVWLRQHWNQIRIGVNPDWFPIEFVNKDGVHAGISSDLIKKIGQDLKIFVKSAQGLTQAKAGLMLKNKQLDVLPASIKTKDKEALLLFTKPYMTSDWVIITNQDHSDINLKKTVNGKKIHSLESLSAEKIAVTNGYVSHQRLDDNWPILELVIKPTVLETLKAVSSGEASIAIVDLETATPLLHSYQMTDLKVNTAAFAQQDHIYFAVRKDWPELVSIINKELDYIGQTEIDRIKNKWRSVPVSLGVQKEDVFIIVIAGLIIIIIVAIWAFTIRRAKTKVEVLLQKETDLLVSNSRHIVMGEMISMLVHQWKQPLTSMMLGISIIKMKLNSIEFKKTDKDFLDKQFDKVENMLDEQNNLISDLRNFFHPDKSKESFNLAECVKGAISILSGVIDKNSISMELNIDSTVQLVGFERELKHVFINLIKNAVDELVEIGVESPLINIHAAASSKEITIQVNDNGNGIKEEILPTIFEPYVSSKALNGTGLGLYMGKLVIEEHFSGSISVRNCTDQNPCENNTHSGACFTLTLPIQ
jgi:signal transduction histidine kinase/ABC-type nitrate/sulfonate/bicarbonate transport system substrate-binding protein